MIDTLTSKYSPISHKLFYDDNSINLYELDNIITQNRLQKNILKFYFLVILFLLIIILYALVLL